MSDELILEEQEGSTVEFQRELKQDRDLPTVHHLVYIKEEGSTKPKLTENGEADKKEFDPQSFFNKKQTLEIEIGCGKGGFLIEYAKARPEINIIGAEWETKWGKYGGDRLHRNQVENARVMRGDFFYFLRDYVPDSSVSAFHMYFPDPWPKAYQRKRRLLKDEFLVELRRAVIAGPEAYFYWGTDFEEYNESAHETLSNIGFMELVIAEAEPTYGIMTNFEKKYRKEGRPIYRSVWRFKK